jgi:Beta-lactamase class C and other penicillin binding proteins
VTDDTLWRIYSMTKPITSVAAMILYEEGRLALTDPVSAFIPAFKDVRVYDGGSDQKQVTVPAAEPVRVWHLLTHTSGLTYGFHRVHPVDALYRAAGFEWGTPPADLAQVCDLYATSRCCSSRGPNGTTRSPPTSSAASSRWSRASAWTSS